MIHVYVCVRLCDCCTYVWLVLSLEGYFLGQLKSSFYFEHIVVLLWARKSMRPAFKLAVNIQTYVWFALSSVGYLSVVTHNLMTFGCVVDLVWARKGICRQFEIVFDFWTSVWFVFSLEGYLSGIDTFLYKRAESSCLVPLAAHNDIVYLFNIHLSLSLYILSIYILVHMHKDM